MPPAWSEDLHYPWPVPLRFGGEVDDEAGRLRWAAACIGILDRLPLVRLQVISHGPPAKHVAGPIV